MLGELILHFNLLFHLSGILTYCQYAAQYYRLISLKILDNENIIVLSTYNLGQDIIWLLFVAPCWNNSLISGISCQQKCYNLIVNGNTYVMGHACLRNYLTIINQVKCFRILDMKLMVLALRYGCTECDRTGLHS